MEALPTRAERRNEKNQKNTKGSLPTRAERRNEKNKKNKKDARINAGILAVTIGCFGMLGWWGADHFISDRAIESNNSVAVETLTESWSEPAKVEKTSKGTKVAVKEKLDVVSGEAFATISIPSLFQGEQAVAEGYGDATEADWEANNRILDDLRFAHYATTSLPGKAGSFAISGHRNGPGAVLENIEDIQPGATATVKTVEGTFDYKLVQGPVRFDDQYTGFTDGYPLLDEGSTDRSDVAKDPKKTPGKYLTVTTCGDWDSSVRVAVVFELVEKN